MKKTELKNKTTVIYKQAPSTPRTAFTLYLSLQTPEKIPGTYSLLNRLFFQGTKNFDAERIAAEIENNAIELYSEYKTDFIRFKALCLNEDVDYTLELMKEIIFNTSCETFEKEKVKFRGEIIAETDSPKTKAFDRYYSLLYKNHAYGNTYEVILENLDKITKNDVLEAYEDILKTSKKTISVTGDFDEDKMTETLEEKFSRFEYNPDYKNEITVPHVEKKKVCLISKEDANQAQIVEGRIFPTYGTKDYATIVVTNAILSSAGLSSRLFYELREKQGLAYTVRSTYETHSKCAAFTAYIGTEPINIKKALAGFETEINKIKSEKVTETELENAKECVIGKRCFFTETNASMSSLIGLYESENLGCDYEEKFIEEVKSVTREDILEMSQRCFSTPSVTVVLAPEKYLSEIDEK